MLELPSRVPGMNPMAIRAGIPWARANMIIAVANWVQ